MRLFKKKLNKPAVYTMKSCSYCKMLITELEKQKVEFVEKDIEKYRDEWNKATRITSMAQTPTVFFNNTYLTPMRDFKNPNQLIEILNGLKNISNKSDIETIELLKTLNFRTSDAFNKLASTLKKLEENTASCNPMNAKVIENVD